MESSSSPAPVSALMRPRVVVAAITATAAVSLSVGYLLAQYSQTHWGGRRDRGHGGSGSGLHRRNAVRRPRRFSQVDAYTTEDGTAAAPRPESRADGRADRPLPADAETAAQAPRSAASLPAMDENNLDMGNVHPTPEARSETVVDESRLGEERWLEEMTQTVQRAGQNIVNLLFRVSEDNARRSAYVHRGCACNGCGIVPIRGIRYRCANCADFDLCETCESQGLHIKTHIFYKVKVPAPPFGPRQMQPVWYPGDPDTCLRNLPRGLMVRLSRETGFERQELDAFWEQWTYMANTEWRDDPDDLGVAMDRKTFERCLVPSGGYRHAAPNLIHDRMFAFYDTNNDDLIGFSEFLHGLSYRKRKDKLRKIFDGYDTDSDGLVNRRDFLRFFRAYYVLYKQMHKDILEGLDDQVMSSIETHQLISNRQPLSSLFGREGGLPPADLRRALSGKSVNPATGEVSVANSAGGVVLNDASDTASREDILTGLFVVAEHNRRRGPFDDRPPFHEDALNGEDSSYNNNSAQANYLEALLHPPLAVDEFPDLLVGRRRNSFDDAPTPFSEFSDMPTDGEEEGMFVAQDPALTHEGFGGELDSINTVDNNAHATDAAVDTEATPARQDHETQTNGFVDTNGHARPSLRSRGSGSRAGGASANPNNLTTAQLLARKDALIRSQMNRKAIVAARKKMHQRWMRRNFYLDEEEGAVAPEGWADDEDVLASNPLGGLLGPRQGGESSTAPQEQQSHDHHYHRAPSHRSRSSSKVRFAEDTEDYEIRSNPSTSSRSVPERWGGMDIPDAERDVGREILYQVMQQAFNELLDILFQEKENLALKAAHTKALRDRYRHLFESIDLGKVALEDEDGTGDVAFEEAIRQRKARSTFGKSVEGMSLEELLAMSGYEVVVVEEEEEIVQDEPEKQNEQPAVPVESEPAEQEESTREEEEGVPEPELTPQQQSRARLANHPLPPLPQLQFDETATTAEEEEEDNNEAMSAVSSVGAGLNGISGIDALDDNDSIAGLDLPPFAQQDVRGSRSRSSRTAEYRDPTMPQFRPNSDADMMAAQRVEDMETIRDIGSDLPSFRRQLQTPSMAALSTAATVATSSEGGHSSLGTSTPPVFDMSSTSGDDNDDKGLDEEETESVGGLRIVAPPAPAAPVPMSPTPPEIKAEVAGAAHINGAIAEAAAIATEAAENTETTTTTTEAVENTETKDATDAVATAEGVTNGHPGPTTNGTTRPSNLRPVLKQPAGDGDNASNTNGAAAANGAAPNGTGSGSSDATPLPIPRSVLIQWKTLDVAEQEARERGGWGKLSYAEFEAIFREEEVANNRLDYLGSWIDFCIP